MENWLDSNEIETIIEQLNPQLQTGKAYDANWQLLKKENSQTEHYLLSGALKTQTPTLMLFDKHQGFVYRRWDGAHWHTELRNIQRGKTAYSEQQSLLKDAWDTLLALTNTNIKTTWYTPYDKQGTFDPRYQLIECDQTWYCFINNSVYEESNRRVKQARGYTEITFSTKCKPVFDLEMINQALDRLIT